MFYLEGETHSLTLTLTSGALSICIYEGTLGTESQKLIDSVHLDDNHYTDIACLIGMLKHQQDRFESRRI